jgi:protein-tyrosine kinase
MQQMSSSLEKAIEKARIDHQKRRAAHDMGLPATPPAASGLFRIISQTVLKPKVMERNKLIPAIEDKAAITAYKVLRTRVLQRMRSNGWRSLIVTGAGSGEGKTLTACNLAVSISKDVNQSVFLVDLDLQHSSVAKNFGLDVKLGLSDYLTGNAEIEDIIYAPDDMDRIAIIPNREPVEHSSDLIASPRMKALMKWIKDRASKPLAIFDMPPVLSCDDVLAFLPSADAVLLVTSEGITERSALEKTLDMLGDADLLGVVLNRSREQQKASAYY